MFKVSIFFSFFVLLVISVSADELCMNSEKRTAPCAIAGTELHGTVSQKCVGGIWKDYVKFSRKKACVLEKEIAIKLPSVGRAKGLMAVASDDKIFVLYAVDGFTDFKTSQAEKEKHRKFLENAPYFRLQILDKKTLKKIETITPDKKYMYNSIRVVKNKYLLFFTDSSRVWYDKSKVGDKVKVFDIQKNKFKGYLSFKGYVQDATLSFDGKYLGLLGFDGKNMIYDITTGKAVDTVAIDRGVSELQFTTQQFAVDGSVHPLKRIKEYYLKAVNISSDNEDALTISLTNKMVLVVEGTSEKELLRKKEDEEKQKALLEKYGEGSIGKRYVAKNQNGDLTVFDKKTNLTWQRFSTAHQAGVYCENLVYAGAKDWRIPSIDELRTLIIGCRATQTAGKCHMTLKRCGGNQFYSQQHKCLNAACGGCKKRENKYWSEKVWVSEGELHNYSSLNSSTHGCSVDFTTAGISGFFETYTAKCVRDDMVSQKFCRGLSSDKCLNKLINILEKKKKSQYGVAARIAEKMCSDKNWEACDQYAFMLKNNLGTNIYFTKAIDVYRDACEHNYAPACYHYAEEIKDVKVSEYCMKRACELGFKQACEK